MLYWLYCADVLHMHGPLANTTHNHSLIIFLLDISKSAISSLPCILHTAKDLLSQNLWVDQAQKTKTQQCKQHNTDLYKFVSTYTSGPWCICIDQTTSTHADIPYVILLCTGYPLLSIMSLGISLTYHSAVWGYPLQLIMLLGISLMCYCSAWGYPL
jgi:hypothetical protein